ncbi:MAG: hypothetical protein AAGA54_10345 [Myxococcota bacterium]
MWLNDGMQRFELTTWREPPRDGVPVPAEEFARSLRSAAPWVRDQIIDFLVVEFGWDPLSNDRHDGAVGRIIELLESGQAFVATVPPSGTTAGDVPDDDDVQALSELAEEEDEEAAAGAQIEGPMQVEPEHGLEPPDVPDYSFEVEPPDVPDYGFEVEPPPIPESGFEVAGPPNP